jgi:hypothetical protein
MITVQKIRVLKQSQHNWWFEDGHHRMHSEYRPCYTVHDLRKHISALSTNVWRLAGDTLNITCNFLYCNHQLHRDFLIALYCTVVVTYLRDINFIFSEPCIVTHIREKCQQDAHFFFIIISLRLSSTCFEQVIVHYQDEKCASCWSFSLTWYKLCCTRNEVRVTYVS